MSFILQSPYIYIFIFDCNFYYQDRGQEEVTTREFNGLPFKANFADSMSGLVQINDLPGTDGFVMSVDPLFAVSETKLLTRLIHVNSCGSVY